MSTPSERAFGMAQVDAVDKAVRLAVLADELTRYVNEESSSLSAEVQAVATASLAWSRVANLLYAHDADARTAAREAADAADRARVPSKDGP